MPIIGYEEAHAIVEKNKSLYWDGWTIVDWKADSLGEMSKTIWPLLSRGTQDLSLCYSCVLLREEITI